MFSTCEAICASCAAALSNGSCGGLGIFLFLLDDSLFVSMMPGIVFDCVFCGVHLREFEVTVLEDVRLVPVREDVLHEGVLFDVCCLFRVEVSDVSDIV
jgi:hypothetical protein